MTTLVETGATGSQIQDLVDRMVHALPDTAPRSHVTIACFSLALMIMKDDITPDEITTGVKGLSEYACLFLSGGGEVKVMVN